MTNRMDYVVFPDGLVMDPNNSSQILLSFGHQDREGIIAEIDLKGLLSTLHFVNDCTFTSNEIELGE